MPNPTIERDGPQAAIAAVVLALLLCGVGFWLGEGGGPPWAPVPIVIGIAGCLAVEFSIPGGPARKSLLGAAVVGAYALTFVSGLWSFGHAFAQCLKQGEDVRGTLEEYRRRNGSYPQSLAQLHRDVPCGRLSRPTILVYEKTGTGYDLRFRDWLVEHVASETASFMAHK